jgi:hypothetical protein
MLISLILCHISGKKIIFSNVKYNLLVIYETDPAGINTAG